MAKYRSIITHNDFDGVASAAICSYIYKINSIYFVSPSTIINSQLSITEKDIVCDLPYPLVCGLWFDHHEGNLQELTYRKIDPQTIPGKFDLQPSCAHVVYNYFQNELGENTHLGDLVKAADLIDTFGYSSIEEWRADTPANIIDSAIKANQKDINAKRRLLWQLTLWLRDNPIDQVATFPEVQKNFLAFRQEEEEMLKIIQRSSYFLPSDHNKEVIILDLCDYNRPLHINKKLAFILYPEALAVLEVRNIFSQNIKTNNLTVAISLGLKINQTNHTKDLGEIMRILNIGDGHKGAAAGKILSKSKAEMLKKKSQTLEEIIKIWLKQ